MDKRVMLCWKYFLPVFKATNRQNYAIEAYSSLWLIIKCYHLDKHTMVSICEPLVDYIPGHNIPCDLYIEHLNRMLKECVHNLKS